MLRAKRKKLGGAKLQTTLATAPSAGPYNQHWPGLGSPSKAAWQSMKGEGQVSREKGSRGFVSHEVAFV